jgi:glycosyltransferase involved in cell wall biosynthesis
VNKNIHILPNGVDILSFDRVSWVSKHSGIHFLTVARIDWQKNHLMVLDALSTMDYKLLKKQWFHRNIVWDGILKQQLEQRIEELGLSSFVTLKWKLFGETLIREYKKNHIFLLPSLSEGQPLTILEAFASKLPVLCTDVGDNNAFVSSHTWWMIPPGDSSALASVFQKMLKTDVKGFQKMWNHAYSLVQDYDWQRVVEKTYELYKIV